MKECLRPRMNLATIILVILLFSVADALVVPAIVARKVTASADYRLPTNYTYGQLKVLVDQINADPNPKVLLTGDSVVQGGGVGFPDELISHYLQEELQNINSSYHVYNLGVSGAAPGDIYFVVKALKLKPADIVVYDLNIGHYGKGKKALIFPKKTAELADKYDHGQSLYNTLQLKSDKLEDWLQLWMTNTWKFYAYREVIKDVYQEKLFGQEAIQPEMSLKPWDQVADAEWKKKIGTSVKRGAVEIEKNDMNLRFTKMMIEEATKARARMLVFNTPLNQQMMAKFDMIDREKYNKNVQNLAQEIQQAGAVYKDYEKLVPSAYFTDSVHPMREGNKLLAKQLHHDLSPWLVGKERTP